MPQDASPFPEGDAPEQVAPGVWRIPLPLPFALRMVNVYALDDGEQGCYLIDSGLGLPADGAALQAGLEMAGIPLDRIRGLVLTHAHPDHIGRSGHVWRASGAPVYLLAGEDEVLYRVWDGENEEVIATLHAMYRANGYPADWADESTRSAHALRRMIALPPREAVRTLRDGDDLQLGAHTYRVYWTPGHADYHLCLLREDGLFFAGDHVLPHISPNIGLYPRSRPNPLADYLGALRRVRDLPARLTLPGHGRPFTALRARCDDLVAHHAARGEELLAHLTALPTGADAAALARHLFGTRLRTPEDLRFALVETLAHLEYLRAAGQVARTEADDCVRYHALRPATTA